MKIILRGPQRRQHKKEVPYDQSIYDFVVYRVFVATASFIIGDEATMLRRWVSEWVMQVTVEFRYWPNLRSIFPGASSFFFSRSICTKLQASCTVYNWIGQRHIIIFISSDRNTISREYVGISPRIIPDGILPNHVMISVIIAPEKSHHLWLGPIGGFWGITWFSERTEAGINPNPNRQQRIKGEL